MEKKKKNEINLTGFEQLINAFGGIIGNAYITGKKVKELEPTREDIQRVAEDYAPYFAPGGFLYKFVENIYKEHPQRKDTPSSLELNLQEANLPFNQSQKIYQEGGKVFQFDPESEDYNLLMDMVQDLGGEERWDQDPDTILNAMTQIAHHETGGTYDPTIEQIGGKPGQEGMGLFQYERGEHQGAHTAINRLTNYYEAAGEEVPDWASQVNKENLWDVSSLNPEQQYILFLADKAMDPTANMSNVDTIEGLSDFWATEHYAGKDVVNKINSFNESMGTYKDTLLDQILPKSNNI